MSESSRWTKEPGGEGDDPRDIDVEAHDPDRVREAAETRPVVHDQEPTGEQGLTSDRPGAGPGEHGDGARR
jgi:hypothetical protein